MPLPALHALVRVVATNAGGLFDGLHTLAVHDGRTGMGTSPTRRRSASRKALQSRVQRPVRENCLK
jgi:hypothetical protein